MVYTEDPQIEKKIEQEPFARYFKKPMGVQYKCKPDDGTHWELKRELGLNSKNERYKETRERRKSE